MARLTRKREWLLYQCQSGAFYEAECWSAFWEMERLLEASGGLYQGDVIERFFELESVFLGKDLYESDLRLFLKEILSFNNEELALAEATKLELLTQLRKANWANGELRRIAKAIADAIGDTTPESIYSQFSELVYLPAEGYLVTMADVDCFILGKECPGSRVHGRRDPGAQ